MYDIIIALSGKHELPHSFLEKGELCQSTPKLSKTLSGLRAERDKPGNSPERNEELQDELNHIGLCYFNTTWDFVDDEDETTEEQKKSSTTRPEGISSP